MTLSGTGRVWVGEGRGQCVPSCYCNTLPASDTSSSTTSTASTYLCATGARNQCSGFLLERRGAGMLGALHREWAGQVAQTRAHTCMSPLALQPQGHTHLPEGKGTKCSRVHAHTHAYAQRDTYARLPPWGQLPSGTSAVALDSRAKGLSACSLHSWSLPQPPTPTAPPPSRRNQRSSMGRASPPPQTPAPAAGGGEARPTVNLGSAPRPPVPTLCLVPVASTTAMVR